MTEQGRHGETEDEMGTILRDAYNPPPPVPRDEIWAALQPRLRPREAEVVSLDEARARRLGRVRLPLAWGVAAAALVVLGVGIGRMTSPGAGPLASGAVESAGDAAPADPSLVRLAAVEHLGRSEGLLRMVRADAQSGRVDPAVGAWAEGLLSQTRLLMDAQGMEDPAIRELLEDLELVLVQIVGVARVPEDEQGRVRSELSLALDGLEQREVLPRIQAVVPPGAVMAGT